MRHVSHWKGATRNGTWADARNYHEASSEQSGEYSERLCSGLVVKTESPLYDNRKNVKADKKIEKIL